MLHLHKEFERVFSPKSKPRVFFAPGRINLIGEHTDYNGGFVLPAAISLGTYALVTKRTDTKLRLYSVNFKDDGIIECDLHNLLYNETHGWGNYSKGMIHYLKREGSLHSGMDILYYGNIPNGAGLSSSASLQVVTGFLLNEMFQLGIDDRKIVETGTEVENNYIGVNSGIMDQFAIGFGKKNHAILLDCNTLEYEYTPTNFGDYTIVIINTNKQRKLSNSKYNERRDQCESALTELRKKVDIDNLCELSPEQFGANRHLITNEINANRARHAVYENARTLEAFNRLREGNLTCFGELMNQSHKSLKEDYEVTGIELDTIVHTAQNLPGVLGARMTGAGFGGCAIALVKTENVETFKQKVNYEYRKMIGFSATFYDAAISGGARELKEVQLN